MGCGGLACVRHKKYSGRKKILREQENTPQGTIGAAGADAVVRIWSPDRRRRKRGETLSSRFPIKPVRVCPLM